MTNTNITLAGINAAIAAINVGFASNSITYGAATFSALVVLILTQCK